MKELVLDASVVLMWFAPDEAGAVQAARLRGEYEEGSLIVTAPSLLFLELINVAGRRWGWAEDELVSFAVDLEAIGFNIAEPLLVNVGAWTARGLTAYDSAYVALAEERDLGLVTDDSRILTTAPEISLPLRE